MKMKELPGWESAVGGARQIFPWVPTTAFEMAGETDAPESKTFVCGPNEAYVAACRAGNVRLPNGQRAVS